MNLLDNIQDYGVLTHTYIALQIADAFGCRDGYWDTLLSCTTPPSINAAGGVVVRIYISTVLKPLGPDSVIKELSRTLLNNDANWDALGITSVDASLIGQDLTVQAKADLLQAITYYSEVYLDSFVYYLSGGYGYGYGYGNVSNYISLIEGA